MPLSAEHAGGFSPPQTAAVADLLADMMKMIEEFAESPLTPEQYECLYRLNNAARELQQLVGAPPEGQEPDAPLPPPNALHEENLCRILLLDRGRTLAALIRQTLSQAPHVLDHCGDRAEALDLFRAQRYDIALVDPRSEPAFPALVRAAECARGDAERTPVVAVVARPSAASTGLLQDAGFDACLARDCGGATLLGLLARYAPAICAEPSSPAINGMRREFLRRTRAAADTARQALERFDRRGLLNCANFVGGMASALGFYNLDRAAVRLRCLANQNDWHRAGQCIDEIGAIAEIAAASADTVS